MWEVARGALKNHKQLSDKVHFSIQCRTVNLTTLRSRLDNIVRLALYRNDYANCPPQSRCKNNQNYEPSNLIITNNFSVTPFTGFGVYKAQKDFLHVLDTYYVDSFNNVLNMFHDKCTQLIKRWLVQHENWSSDMPLEWKCRQTFNRALPVCNRENKKNPWTKDIYLPRGHLETLYSRFGRITVVI